MGVFDEGCMGMFNAIIPDELLHPTGVFKERLSQSTLYAAMQQVSDAEARGVLDWLLKKGMTFQLGQGRGDRADRGADPAAMQDVHRRRPARRTSSAAPPSASNTSRASRTSRPASDLAEGPAEQRGPPAGEVPQIRPRALRRRSGAAFQRSGRMRRTGWPGDLPAVARAGLRAREHAARYPLGPALQGRRRE